MLSFASIKPQFIIHFIYISGIDFNQLNKSNEDFRKNWKKNRKIISRGGVSSFTEIGSETNNNINASGIAADLAINNNKVSPGMAVELGINNNKDASGIAADSGITTRNEKEDEIESADIESVYTSSSEDSENAGAPVINSTKKKRESAFSYIYLVWSEYMDFVKVGSSHTSAARFRGRFKTVSKMNIK